MGSIGGFELVLIFLVVLLIFGAKKIPEIARGIGQGINEFKAATREISSEINMDDSQQRRSSQRKKHSIEAPRQGEPTPRGGTYEQEREKAPAESRTSEEPSAKEPREQQA